MPKNKRTAHYYASQARIADNQQAEQFCADRQAEGVFADVRGYVTGFWGLVMLQDEHDAMLAGENDEMRKRWNEYSPENPFYPVLFISGDSFYAHPYGRAGETKMDALQASHAVFLGAQAIGESWSVALDDDAAAEAVVAVVDDGRLTGGYGPDIAL